MPLVKAFVTVNENLLVYELLLSRVVEVILAITLLLESVIVPLKTKVPVGRVPFDVTLVSIVATSFAFKVSLKLVPVESLT